MILYTLDAYMYISTNQYIKDERNWLIAWLYAWKISGFQRGGYVDEHDNFFSQNLHEKIDK